MRRLLKQRFAAIRERLPTQGAAMNHCLSMSKIAEFEKRRQTRLPWESRLFLAEVGNGGSGMARLGETPAGYPESPRSLLVNLSKPFPFTTPWIWEFENEEDENPQRRRALSHGHLVTSRDLCGGYWLLIVTGPERGQVWNRADMGIQPSAPKRDFLTWYKLWLDGETQLFREYRRYCRIQAK